MALINENIENNLPVIVLNMQVLFPGIPVTLEFSNKNTVKTCVSAYKNDSFVFVVTSNENDGQEDKLYQTGTVSIIKHLIRLPDGNVRVQMYGIQRGIAVSFTNVGNSLLADVKTAEDSDISLTEDIRNELFAAFLRCCNLLQIPASELVDSIKETTSSSLFTDMIAANLPLSIEEKEQILSLSDPQVRAESLIKILEVRLGEFEMENEIAQKVRRAIDDDQRAYYLKNQLKVIQDELDYTETDEIEEYLQKIDKCITDEKSKEKLKKEVNKLSKIPFGAAEGTVIHSYLDTVLEYPFGKFTEDSTDINTAKKILEKDHYGMKEVKRRIIEFLAVRKLTGGEKNAQILCLVGAPGVGKTSVAQSIARAMGRKFIRISLGGIRDEAEIRGHRKTYLGAMPGRIIAGITEAGCENPLVLLDEIDKMTTDTHGDPSSALLEVLDGEQNKNFRDHFFEIPVDLSKCIFIATANSLDYVQRPLLDRMEVIEMPSYTREEKLMIAKRHLIPKQIERAGLKNSQVKFTDKAIYTVIDSYTHEAGVRSLERCISSLCRKAAVMTCEEEADKVTFTDDNINTYLEKEPIIQKKVKAKGRVGIVNGMAYTENGGDLLEVEALSMPGTGKIILTGSLGDVMKESANISLSYIRSIADKINIRPSFYRDTDIHVHFPEGAVPKDGPSAGVTVTTAIISQLTGCPVKGDVAMTGEISLKGDVLPIGGLREKTMAAYKSGIKTILLPADNEKSLCKVDDKVKKNVKFVFCSNINDVLNNALMLDKCESSALKNYLR